MYRIEFVLRGSIAFETDVNLPILEEEDYQLEQANAPKTRGRKPGRKPANAVVPPPPVVVTPPAATKNNKNKKVQPPPPPPQPLRRGGRIGRGRRKGQSDYEDQQDEESERGYKEELPSKKLKKGKKQVVDSEQDDDDEDENVGEDPQGSEDEAKLLELEGELEEELAHLGEDGEDVDNFEEEEEDDQDELDKLERYAITERPMAKLSQRFKDLENLSDSNLSEDPNYQKLTKRQKNIVKNNMTGQVDTEYLQLPNQVKSTRKKNKFVTEEDQLKKVEKEEKRRAQMQKQMEDLKRQTVDKILNEAGTKQKKRKEKEEIEKDNKINHQYRKLPSNAPRIRLLNNAEGSIVSITKTVFHSLLNPFPQILETNLMSNLEEQAILNESQMNEDQTNDEEHKLHNDQNNNNILNPNGEQLVEEVC